MKYILVDQGIYIHETRLEGQIIDEIILFRLKWLLSLLEEKLVHVYRLRICFKLLLNICSELASSSLLI